MYKSQDSDDILEDIYTRAEFYNLKDTHDYVDDIHQVPLEKIHLGNSLELRSYQQFVTNFMSPETPYNRLLMKHNTGSGKTITAISLSLKFIEYFKKNKNDIGSIFIIGFEGSKKAFRNDLFKYPAFGFISSTEILEWNLLKQKSNDSDKELREFNSKMKKRLSNRKQSGYYVFIGYAELVNKLFITKTNISELTESEIKQLIENKTIQINKPFLKKFENSLMICDEIHNVYNSSSKNNWGIAIQYIIDNVMSLKSLYMSATPINNNPSEIVDILNLLVTPDKRIQKKDLFTHSTLKDNAFEIINRLSKGRVSYLLDKNIKYYPSKSFIGEDIPDIKYLKFVRTEMSKLQLIEYNKLQTETMNFEDKYLLDFIIPNPNDDSVGIYKKADMKLIKNAQPTWLLENGITINNNVVSGPCLKHPLLSKISQKYNTMVINLINTLKNKGGKTLIYHNNVSMSGVLFIGEILLMNGFITDNVPINSNTLCSLCGFINSEHRTECKFKPAKFVMVHGRVEKYNINLFLDKFNSSNNINGEEYSILIGSQVISESYHFNCIRNLYIMSRPDNISMLIQLIGRAVRNKSHNLLLLNLQHVNISLYTCSLPSGALSYEELKYKQKVNDQSQSFSSSSLSRLKR